MTPSKMGKQLVCDVTVVDALAPSRLNQGSRNCERQRCVRRNLLHIANFLKPLYHCSFKRKFYRSSALVAGMSSLLVVSFCCWDSGWYGVPYFRCGPRVCLLPQHDDTHVT